MDIDPKVCIDPDCASEVIEGICTGCDLMWSADHGWYYDETGKSYEDAQLKKAKEGRQA